MRVLGYPVETVLAEKIATAIALGPANTRVRDYADIYTLTGLHVIAHRTARKALLATAAFRGTPVQPLSDAIENLVDLRNRTFNAYRNSLGNLGQQLPASLQEIVTAAVTFAARFSSRGHRVKNALRVSLTRSAFTDSGHGIRSTGIGSYQEDEGRPGGSLRAGQALADAGGSCGRPASLRAG